MTLKRLLIVVTALVVLAGGGLLWLARVAYTPQGRARIIIAQLKGDTTSLHGWLLSHHLARPGFSEPPEESDAHSQAGNATVTGMLGEDLRDLVRQFHFLTNRQVAAAEEMDKLGREVSPIVIEALRDGNNDVRLMAIQACGKLRDPAAIGPLVQYMRDPPIDIPPGGPSRTISMSIPLAQVLCQDSLVEIGPEAYDSLMGALKGSHFIERRGMPELAARKWGDAAVPPLIKSLDDSEEAIRWRAADELGKLKDKRATDALVRRLGDPEWVVTSSAARALGEIGDRKAIPALLTMLKDGRVDDRARASAASALARMGQHEGLEHLHGLLQSGSPDNQALAAEALEKLGVKLPPASPPATAAAR